MGQGSYVLLLIVLTVVMAATLVVFALAFDTYVGSDDVFANLKLQDITSDIVDVKMPALLQHS